jgi:hypothetical protein
MVVLGVIPDAGDAKRPGRSSSGASYDLYAPGPVQVAPRTSASVSLGCTVVAPNGCVFLIEVAPVLSSAGVRAAAPGFGGQELSRLTLWNGSDHAVALEKDSLLARFCVIPTRAPELAFWDEDERPALETLKAMMMPRRPIDVMARSSMSRC